MCTKGKKGTICSSSGWYVFDPIEPPLFNKPTKVDTPAGGSRNIKEVFQVTKPRQPIGTVCSPLFETSHFHHSASLKRVRVDNPLPKPAPMRPSFVGHRRRKEGDMMGNGNPTTTAKKRI